MYQGVWLDVDLKTDINIYLYLKEIWLHAQNVLTFWSSIFNIHNLGSTMLFTLKETTILALLIDKDMHINFEHYARNVHGRDLDMLIILR